LIFALDNHPGINQYRKGYQYGSDEKGPQRCAAPTTSEPCMASSHL
jgi:hypothetical protein